MVRTYAVILDMFQEAQKVNVKTFHVNHYGSGDNAVSIVTVR